MATAPEAVGRRAGRLAVLVLALAPSTARADAYAEAMALARQAAAGGDHAAAARLLEAPAREWPQDFPLQLERAWQLLRAGRYGPAADAYRAALALEPASPEARQGLDDARALRGAASQRWLALLGGAALPGDGGPTIGLGVLSLDALWSDRWTAGALVRSFAWQAGDGAGAGRRRGPTLDGQQELHLSAGWWGGRLGASLQLAWIGEAQGAGGVTVGHPGLGGALTATARAGLEWQLALAGVRYDDADAAQEELRATLPLGRRFAIGAGGRAQQVAGRRLLAGLASAELRGPWRLRVDGELGTQHRPFDVAAQSLYDGDADLLLAVRAKADLPLAGQVRALLGWDAERWRAPPTGTAAAVTTTTHRVTAGLVVTW